MKTIKKCIAICLAALMALSMLIVGVSAEDTVQWNVKDTAIGGELTGFTGEIPEVITIPETVDGIQIEIIGERLFANCETIREVYLPDTVFKIEYAAFLNCSNLEKVHANAPLSFLDSFAFADCVRLTQAPSCCFDVSSSVFRNCKSLESADLTGAYLIDDKAFSGCTSLREITISANEIGANAFDLCTALTTVYDMRYLHEYDPYYAMSEGWSFDGNIAFFNAEHIRVHYETKEWEDHFFEHEMNSGEGFTVTVDHKMQKGETCYWWLDGELEPGIVEVVAESEEELCGDTILISGYKPGTAWIKAEVVDADGDVIYLETHQIEVSMTRLQRIMQFLKMTLPMLFRLLYKLFPNVIGTILPQ